jgi:hypothetical protein
MVVWQDTATVAMLLVLLVLSMLPPVLLPPLAQWPVEWAACLVT